MNLQAITFKSLLFLVFAYAAGYFSFSYLWILFLSLLWLLDAKLTKKRVEERVMQDVRDLEKNLYHYDEMRLECAELITLLPEWARNPSTESVGWMNAIIVKLWPGLRHVLKSTILGNLGYYTIYYKPGWMDKLFVHHVDVGSNPLLIEGIELMESRSDMIIMDLSLRMAWHDALIYIKMAFKGISIPIKISDINFSCKLRLKMSPLITQWPCFGELAVGFVGTPQVDLHLSVGGLPISSVPLLHGWLMQYMTDMCVWCMGYPVMLPFPMVDPPSAEEKAAQQLPPQGILRVVVHKMLYLNKSSGKIRRTVLNSRVKCDVGIGTRMQQTTPVDYHKKVTPINQPFEIIVHDLKTEQLIVKVRTSGMDLMTAANKGKATFDLNMLHANKPVQVWHPLEGAKSGHVLVSMTWKPFIHDGLGILQSAIKSEGSFSCAALHLRVRKAQVNYQELRDRSKNIDSRVSIQLRRGLRDPGARPVPGHAGGHGGAQRGHECDEALRDNLYSAHSATRLPQDG
jgi:Ca2+-dependent lipid-binding protein